MHKDKSQMCDLVSQELFSNFSCGLLLPFRDPCKFIVGLSYFEIHEHLHASRFQMLCKSCKVHFCELYTNAVLVMHIISSNNYSAYKQLSIPLLNQLKRFFTDNESLNSSKTSAPSLSKSWSSMTLNSNDSDTRLRSRTESFSSQHSTKSVPGTVEMLSSGDTFDDFGWNAEFLPLHSQDVFDDFSQDSATRFTSTSSLFSDSEIDDYFTADDSTQSSLFSISSLPVENDKSDDGLVISSSQIKNDKSDDADEEEKEKKEGGGWTTVGSNRKKWGMLNFTMEKLLSILFFEYP